jgi:hypothetical protein
MTHVRKMSMLENYSRRYLCYQQDLTNNLHIRISFLINMSYTITSE